MRRERLIRPTLGTRRPDKMRQHRIRQRAQDNKCAINVGCGVSALSDLRSAPVGWIRCASIASGNAHRITNVPFMSDAA
ncbi:hypothetical protein BE946_18790 [Escherichia coli]|nr:hypothetical protein BE946_18790 [Escherichia coli]